MSSFMCLSWKWPFIIWIMCRFQSFCCYYLRTCMSYCVHKDSKATDISQWPLEENQKEWYLVVAYRGNCMFDREEKWVPSWFYHLEGMKNKSFSIVHYIYKGSEIFFFFLLLLLTALPDLLNVLFGPLCFVVVWLLKLDEKRWENNSKTITLFNYESFCSLPLRYHPQMTPFWMMQLWLV